MMSSLLLLLPPHIFRLDCQGNMDFLKRNEFFSPCKKIRSKLKELFVIRERFLKTQQLYYENGTWFH